MHKLTLILIFFVSLFCNASNSGTDDEVSGLELIDKKASPETSALYYNLKELSKTNLLYGHQDDLAYGIGWWNIDGRSDVKDVCGSYPAVFGWDLGNLGAERNIDSVLFTDIQKWIIKAYELGAVNTISWHMENPVTLKNSWDKTNAVKQILPGGRKHEYFKNQLKKFAEFNSALKDKKGISIPIIFRPFHEHNGSWFWWGKNNCTKNEYISLWKFTIHYLRDSLEIHNLIYVYSPDGQFADYTDRFPGNDYVDMLGLDYYFKGNPNEKKINHFVQLLIELTKLAKSKNKIAILSETGYESIPDPLWHSRAILNPIKKNRENIELSYMLCWRNANKKHHFGPYPGHSSAKDFLDFYNDPFTVFADGLKNLYTLKN